MSIGGLGLPEIGIILGIVFLIFAPSRLGESLSGLGKGLRTFKEELRGSGPETKS